MDPTGPTAQRFPLIARPRPPCTPLPARISHLAALAERAAHDGDLTAASRVHNQAALIASDCGHPGLARTWCHRHARAYLHTIPRDPAPARHALEPLVNLARLHIRAGDSDAALALLNSLYQAILTRTNTSIDGIAVPAAELTNTADSHRQLSQWLWSVHLADGSRALTTAGRWTDAEAQLRRHNGIGRRMLDGRQVAVIAHATLGEHTQRRTMIQDTEPGPPWEALVTATLATLTQPADERPPDEFLHTMLKQHQHLKPDTALAVFRTRLGLSIVDAIGCQDHPIVRQVVRDLVRHALDTRDGYAARDLLSHHATAETDSAPAAALAKVVDDSGLGHPLPAPSQRVLETALATAEAVIMRTTVTSLLR